METMVHAFELAKLGKAPFKYVGFWSMPSRALLEVNPEAWNNQIRSAPCPVGSCAYCGTALQNHFIIQGVDGTKFAVGCECVKKTGDKGLICIIKLAEKRRLQEEKDLQRKIRKQAEYFAETEEFAGLSKWERMNDWRKIIAWRFTLDDMDRLAGVRAILKPLAEMLQDGRKGFRDSVSEDMLKGVVPKGRAHSIVLDILAGFVGRHGSRKFNEEYNRLEEILTRAQNLLQEIES